MAIDVDCNDCIDYASGKVALEYCNHPEYMTKEYDYLPYGTTLEEYGYLGIHHPANITLDLSPLQEGENVTQEGDANCGQTVLVKQISIKFMDPDDPLNLSPSPEQRYAFRLLCSDDMVQWTVLYDTTTTENQYRVGWQHFINLNGFSMRYFRVHALHNPASSGFHIVRLRLYNEERIYNPEGKKFDLSSTGVYECEVNDTTPLATKLLNVAERLYRGTRKVADGASNTEEEQKAFEKIYNYVVERAFELQAVDGKVDQVRKIITPLISKRMEVKQNESIRSTRRQWLFSFVFIVVYTLVSIYCAIKLREV